MTKSALALSHLAALLAGAVGATFFLSAPRTGTRSGAGSGQGDVTILPGLHSPVKEASFAQPNPNSFGATSLEQSGDQRGNEDLSAAEAAGKSIRDRENRNGYTQSDYADWGGKNGPEAANWVNSILKGDEKSDALYSIADGWSRANPEGAAKWFDENTSGLNRKDALSRILEAWGRKAPETALAWAGSLDEHTRSWVMDSLAEGWAARDPAAAAQAAERLFESDFGAAFLTNVAGQWAKTAPAAAAAWATTLRNADARAISLLEIGTHWALSEPDKATAWISSLQTEEDKSNASLGTASGWSGHDPGSTLKWAVSAIDNPDTRRRIVEEVMLDWSSNDPNSAAQWLNAQPAGLRKDEILLTFSHALIDEDPASAVTWVSTISDQAKRQENLSTMLKKWIATDGARARQWVDLSNLGNEFKARFGTHGR